ncbi:Dimer-Tnp-hAT domain-containing protein [Pyrenophora tritici-repentis]|nr:Dimer-Tnp-hAT domain-containing protein [Pyrenophora tritici-repentis]
MAKRRALHTSSSSKRLRVAAATDNVVSTPAASPQPASQPASQRRSPRKALAAASQATASSLVPTFESQFLESHVEDDIVAPTEGSRAVTVATTEAGHKDNGQDKMSSAADSFDGIDWARLPGYMKPLAGSKRPKSWIFRYGYRVVERQATNRIWFVCKYCHIHKIIDAGGGGLFNITQATTSAATHLSQPKRGHNLTKDGPKSTPRAQGQLSLRQAFDAGLEMPQPTANALGNFDAQCFRVATVMWLVNQNHPVSELTAPGFREMIRFANPEAEAALWDAYGNTREQYSTEEQYMREWRKDGPIGVLVDIINYIKTPQQYELFRSFQRRANADLPAEERLKVLEPVKPVVTRWNSYYAAFERATKLSAAYNLYAEHHINRIILEDAHANKQNNKRPDAPSWMRSTGLRAADWAVIAEYQDCLTPLKYATKRLEGRSKDGKYGAIYEVIPVFEYVLSQLEDQARPFEQVDFNAHPEAPEDHLKVNLLAAWAKANDYYTKLDASPAYYAARPRQSYTAATSSNNIDEAISAILGRNEPQWTQEQYTADGNPVQYWIQLLPKYPHLAQFAIDIMTIPASSSDCKRLFSELGDLLEPKRRALGSELLAALQLNSYYDAFVRAVQLSDAINLYAAYHIERTARDDAYATIHNKKKPVVPL